MESLKIDEIIRARLEVSGSHICEGKISETCDNSIKIIITKLWDQHSNSIKSDNIGDCIKIHPNAITLRQET